MDSQTLEQKIKDLETELSHSRARVIKLEAAGRALRDAQRAYMSNRGNQEFGKQVAIKARELDEVLSG